MWEHLEEWFADLPMVVAEYLAATAEAQVEVLLQVKLARYSVPLEMSQVTHQQIEVLLELR
jgi:hypothetical protein